MPKIGLVYVERGQHYRCIGFSDHICRDGSPTILAHWEGRCFECGELFQFRTSAMGGVLLARRRCDLHKQPGRPTRFFPPLKRSPSARASRRGEIEVKSAAVPEFFSFAVIDEQLRRRASSR